MNDLNPPDYNFIWTVDGENWDGRFFDGLDELRDFASDLVSANEENPEFKFYGRRFEVMDTCDMLDYGIRPERVRLASDEEVEDAALTDIIGPEKRAIFEFSTRELVDELSDREGVSHARATDGSSCIHTRAQGPCDVLAVEWPAPETRGEVV